MTNNFNTPQHDNDADKLRREQEALWEALNSCDIDTYRSVIALLGLTEVGSRHE